MIDDALLRLAGEVGATLASHGETLVTAESCTGGGVAEAVTAVAGSSAWFEAGFVTYSNRSKQTLLAVPSATLERFGAVSEETVCAMAAGALARVSADWAIAVSGIAGPAGGVPDKPVGTIWINWTSRAGSVRSRCYHFDGDRSAVRYQSVAAALCGLLDVIRA